MRNHHGIPWNAIDVPYDELEKLLNIILRDVNGIYVKGLERRNGILNTIKYSKSVINLEDLDSYYHKCHYHNYYHRALRYNSAFENV